MDFDKDIVKEGYNQIAAAYFLEAKQDADGVLAHYVSKLLELLKNVRQKDQRVALHLFWTSDAEPSCLQTLCL